MTVAGGAGHHPAMADRSGPLSGIKIIELAGIGPAPYTCMMLADAGAQVLRLERAAPGAVERGEEIKASDAGPYWDLLNRSRPSVGIDLKNPDAVELVLGLGVAMVLAGWHGRRDIPSLCDQSACLA